MRERDRHEQEVRDYFHDRPGRMIEIDLALPDSLKWKAVKSAVSKVFPGKHLASDAQDGRCPHENRQF